MNTLEARSPGTLRLCLLLTLAIMGMSVAGPLVRLASAPALALAAWRLLFATTLTGGIGLVRRRPTGLHRRQIPLLALSGLLLGVHFATWIPSLRLTSVAASVVLVNTQPLFVALLAPLFLGERPGRQQLLGIGLAMAGGGVIFLEGDRSGTALTGNLLALAGALAAAGYYVAGRRLRPHLDLWAYVTPVYGVAALVLFATALVGRVELLAFPGREWLIFLLLALGPSLLGHTLLNWALRHLPAPVVNTVPLGEPLGATLLAAAIPAIGEIPGPLTLLGGALTLGGILLALAGSRRRV